MQRDYRNHLRVQTKRNATYILIGFIVITVLLIAQQLQKGQFSADDEAEGDPMKLLLIQCGSVDLCLGALVLISSYYSINAIELAGVCYILPQVVVAYAFYIKDPAQYEKDQFEAMTSLFATLAVILATLMLNTDWISSGI